VVRIRDKAAEGGKRRFGNYVKAVLSVLLAWGVERGHMALNPAKGVNTRKRKGAPDANRPWKRAILKNAPSHDAITLCANSSGEPWTVCGFRASWRRIRLKL
jgi:hypothetical protein